MAEYIEREAAIEAICKEFSYVYCHNCGTPGTGDDYDPCACDDCYRKNMMWTASKVTVERVLNALPSFPERKKGKWAWNINDGFYYCSECEAISPREDQNGEYCDCPNFCPNCGADMMEAE